MTNNDPSGRISMERFFPLKPHLQQTGFNLVVLSFYLIVSFCYCFIQYVRGRLTPAPKRVFQKGHVRASSIGQRKFRLFR